MNDSKHLLDEYGVDLVTSDLQRVALKLEVDGGVVVLHEGSSPWPDEEKESLKEMFFLNTDQLTFCPAPRRSRH